MLCCLLVIVFLVLLAQVTAFAAGLTYGREKLKSSTSSNVSGTKRLNMAAAQKLTARAFDKVVAAQDEEGNR